MNFTIERMNAAHIVGVAKIEQASFSLPWSEKAFWDELSNNQATYFVAVKNAEVIGFAGMYCVLDECYITNIAVTHSHRGQGVGTALMNALAGYALANGAALLTLEVRVSNSAALALYKNHDFAILGTRKNFYLEPLEDGYIMTKFLKKGDALEHFSN